MPNRSVKPFVLGLVACLLIALAPVAVLAEGATLAVQVDRPGVKVSPLLYGIFFEEINRAGDGGIYGEMIQNRSFEDATGPGKPTEPVAWSLVASDGAEGTIALDDSRPLNPKTPHALRLAIAKTAGGRVGVANDGFKPLAAKKPAPAGGEANDSFDTIAVRKGQSYALSLYARCDAAFKGPLIATLEGPDGKVLASAKIDGIGDPWRRYHCELTASDTTAAGRLVLAASVPGTLWLDVVSLFPKNTWKNRPNGLRPDLAEMLAGMKPAFVRFPGGCYVEGDTLANASRWKESIGDIAARPGHWNLWGYRSNDGLGYHEYLEMCEDLGAEPLFVINCGMSHVEQHEKGLVEVPNLGEYLQDALDAIEYANGPADSKWGSLRAKAGHPAPFNLKYLEVGNENGGPTYEKHYRVFYDALKAKYPQITLVADSRVTERPMEIHDEHYYNSPYFFMQNAGKYDKYDRQAHKVYVGEYAVTQGAGQGNLIAALGEAAFMTGMERNADVVIMSSYAPLFVHPAWRRWNPNAIVFDNSRVYGTPSYHVQAMFAQHRADVVLPVELESPQFVDDSPKAGMIGVGTWHTQAEFKDIRVTRGDKVLFESDFSKGLKGWRTKSGKWDVKDGELVQSGSEMPCVALAGDKNWTDYTLTLKARKLSGAEGFLILIRAPNDRVKAWWNLGGWGNRQHGLELPGGADSERVPGRIETGRWYDIRIELEGSQVRCFLDGKRIHDSPAPRLKSLYAVAGRAQATGEVILKVVNVSPAAIDTRVDLRGVGQVDKSATAVVLSGAGPDDENSFAQPTKIVPVTRQIDPAGPSFRHSFPPYSATILRLRAK